LAQQIDGRRPQDQKAADPFALAATLVNDASQGLKQLRHPMNFVEDYQAVFKPVEVQAGTGQLVAILPIFQIQIQRVPLLADHPRQRSFADLARPDQSDGSLPIQGGLDDGGDVSLD